MQSAVALAASQRGDAKQLPESAKDRDALERRRERETVPSRER